MSAPDRAAHEVAERVHLALKPLFAERFAPSADGLRAGPDGVTSPGWRSAWTERANHVGARLPATADQPVEAGVGVSELYRLGIVQVGAQGATRTLDEGRAIYRDVFPSTDATFVASPERLEWAYTLRDDAAPTVIKLRLHLPKHLPSARLDARGGLELVDDGGNALLRVPRPVAVDSAGISREATLGWDGSFLTVSLDRTGLQYPVVLDPAVETVVWEARVQAPQGRYRHSSTYDSKRGRVVMFGGIVAGLGVADTWEWDGSVWTLRATTGPSQRSGSPMVFDSARGFSVMYGGASTNDLWEWDGTTWFLRCNTAPCSTAPRPGGRNNAAMAYDPVRGKAILFGGDLGGVTSNETWTWDGTAWAAAAVGPPKRSLAAMTFDATGSRSLLFGGADGATIYGDLWAFDGTSWTSVTTTGGPPAARFTPGFAFQAASGKALLFGGSDSGSTQRSDTWEFTSATNTWTNLGLSGPAARTGVSAVYDPTRQSVVSFGGYGSVYFWDTWEFRAGAWTKIAGALGELYETASTFDSFRNRVVLFGGRDASGAAYGGTWEWSGTGWTPVCTAAPCSTTTPPPRHGAAMAYDSSRHAAVLYGGFGGTGDVWEFDGAAWVKRCTTTPCTTTTPGSRAGVAMAFDSKRGRTVMFGGNPGSDTWEWDGSLWTQVCTSAPCSTTLPAARTDAGMAFDPDRGKLVLFGGRTSSNVTFNDTWEYDGVTWTQVSTTGPSPRAFVKLAYDTVRKKTVLFGGNRDMGSPPTVSGETWEWNGSTWTLAASTGPGTRYGGTLDFDAARRRIVTFGGRAQYAAFSDTWEYYTRGGACSAGTQCATGFCVDGVCCEQLSCGACQACNLATAPGQCAAVLNADDTDSCPAAVSTCDATGACKKKLGQSCGGNGVCASGFCADNVCCDQACTGGCDTCSAAGACTIAAKSTTGKLPGCGQYLCDGASGACPTSCAVDGDCATGSFCAAGGVCQTRRALGATCNTSPGGDCNTSPCLECAGSATCKDGFCCATACAGSCFTCAATPGTCTSVKSADDLDTCTGAKTCSAGGSCLAKNGQTCSVAGDCASGFCVDGVCCNTACGGACDVCNATAGTCTVVAQGNGGAPSCGAFLCNGTNAACPTTCGNDADCASGSFCSAAGLCVSQKAQGNTCNQAAGADCKSSGCRVCATGNCIDGYCCDSACGGACDACNGGNLGWAGAVNGTCRIAPASYAGSPACLAYACNGSSASCATSCTADAQCGSGFYCNAAGACVAQKAQGAACNLASDCKVSGTCRACSSGNCVDGFCCNTACSGQCEACDVSGAAGSCLPVTGAAHLNPALAARVVCEGAGTCAAQCNGVDTTKCHYLGTATACGTTSCSAGVTTNVGTCDGAGACSQTKTPCLSYACGATTCKSACASDADCASAAYYCLDKACVAKKVDGEACGTADGACVSGNCVDGVCCNVSACGAGERCNLLGTIGKCAKANGVACSSSTECGSGFCVDGVCCNNGCTGQCEACDVADKVGLCSPAKGSPRGGRSACAGGTGACAAVCDGADTARCNFPTEAQSCGANTCSSATGTPVETHTSFCDGKGNCSDKATTCGAYACGATTCKNSCLTNTDCRTGYFCEGTACVPIKGLGTSCSTAATCTSGACVDGVCCAESSCTTGKSCSAGSGALKGFCVSLNGTACAADSECASGACVDGVCCDNPCKGSCQACNQFGSVGKCVNIVGAPIVGHPACSGTSTDAECAQRCDGTDGFACKYPGTTTSCGKPSCGGGAETQVSTCDGAGACKPATKTCAPYVCGPTACLSTCTKNEECGKGNYCKSGSCVKVEGLGKDCGSNAECGSDFCVEGVCCSVSSCGTGSSCAKADSITPGVCLRKKGVDCTKADDCASGRCVDGVCCDLACDGQCEACDVKGSEGSCTPVVGGPHGARKACDDKAATDCGKSQCDGKTRDKCDGFANGGTTSCGEDSCTADKRFQKKGTCDGAGGCARPDPKPCTPYACDAAASSGCKSSCATEADCADGFSCDGGVCVQGAKCSEDRLSSIDRSGVASPCTPYRCGPDGKCSTSCGSSEDCAPGTICDTTVKACVVVQADTGGDGGCAVATDRARSASARGPVVTLALLGLLSALRRWRARAA